MSGKASVRNWIIILAVLVATGLATAAWPLIWDGLGGAGAPELSTPMPVVTLPFAVPFLDITEVNGFILIVVLAAVVIGGIAVVGGGLATLYVLLDRQAETVKESEEFQTHVSALEQKEKERLAARYADRSADPVPPHRMPRWEVLSNSLIALLFTVVTGMITIRAVVPIEASFTVGTMRLNTGTTVVVGLVVTALLVLAWRMRPERLEAIDESDGGPIPWDTIWVVLTGVVVLGLGIGYVVYLNVPG